MKKPILWLLVSRLDHPELAYAAPTLAWMATDCQVLFETYFESERNGRLFAENGSTVLGGFHHQQFNYLCARFDVHILRLGKSEVFESSIQSFGLMEEASADDAAGLYTSLMHKHPEIKPSCLFLGPSQPLSLNALSVKIQPYLFPEILHRRALGLPASRQTKIATLSASSCLDLPVKTAFLTGAEEQLIKTPFTRVDRLKKIDTWFSITARLATRWKAKSKEVVFADPAAVLAAIATHCRHKRIALYAPEVRPAPADVHASCYTEAVSPAASLAATLAVEIGNPVIHGRQTGDGDIFEIAKQGVCIQIVDPNRPAFPVVEEAFHPWAKTDCDPSEPSDEQLRAWAREGRVLTTLVIHSGEVAHNEAMLALTEMAGWTGLKFGIGVHASRYESCPQLWELIAVARENGGARGLVEPLLHSGGLGVMAECNCPPEKLAEHCEKALARIRSIAGKANTPRGYYAFMDSNLDALNRVRGDLFSAIASQGLEYIVSSARPGRNRLLWKSKHTVAINQTPRVVHGASPFVRITSADDLETTSGAHGAGWIIGTLDAPVVAFSPYIWRHGKKIMDLVEALKRGTRINTTPSTIARYARILSDLGLLPRPICLGKSIGIAE